MAFSSSSSIRLLRSRFGLILLLLGCAAGEPPEAALIGKWEIEGPKHDHDVRKTMHFDDDGVYRVAMRMRGASTGDQWREDVQTGTWRVNGDTLFTDFAVLNIHAQNTYVVKDDTLYLAADLGDTVIYVPHLRVAE